MAMPPIANAVTHAAALELWNYHRIGHDPSPADGMVVFGSNDLRVAQHAAALFQKRLAPWILFSGARGRMTEHWPETEADAMARIARECGVPAHAILIERRATNTGENIRYSRDLLAANGLQPRSLIAVQKPYMERRTFAALEVQWKEVSVQVSSPPLSFEDYCTEELPPRLVIEAMVGDFQRILDYPALGFASHQAVTASVCAAFQSLVAAGYDKQLRGTAPAESPV